MSENTPAISVAPVALITGITGQDGSYLTELLLAKGYEVHGIVRRTSSLLRSRIEHLRTDDAIYGKKLFLHYGDLGDGTTLRRLFAKVQPDEFYHLAGQSHVGLSFEIPESTAEEVALATLRILEICRDQAKPVRFYHAATSELFGRALESPQTEETRYRPSSPYGVAKAFAAEMTRVYRESHGLFVCNGILYNHESPRRGENFVTRKITSTVAAIKLGQKDKLVLGNTDAQRDWGHARDYVEAMWRMLQHETADDYIVATGKLHSVLDFVQAAFAVVDLPWDKYLERSSELVRLVDPTTLVGDPTKIYRELGWQATTGFEDLVREMVEADLALLAK